MQRKDLEIFNEMPVNFWAKDREGTYLFANAQIVRLAGGEVAGKSDRELPWAHDTAGLLKDDKVVFETGKPVYLHEFADVPGQGRVNLSVCKWLGDFEGKPACFGISFVVDK